MWKAAARRTLTGREAVKREEPTKSPWWSRARLEVWRPLIYWSRTEIDSSPPRKRKQARPVLTRLEHTQSPVRGPESLWWHSGGWSNHPWQPTTQTTWVGCLWSPLWGLKTPLMSSSMPAVTRYTDAAIHRRTPTQSRHNILKNYSKKAQKEAFTFFLWQHAQHLYMYIYP